MALKDYSGNEAVRSKGTGPGIHITPLFFRPETCKRARLVRGHLLHAMLLLYVQQVIDFRTQRHRMEPGSGKRVKGGATQE